ncbi:uncharacterized protein [Amphiura filiformis]|uniref:uncharacterized protein n=1 Tax=Amphiura filiformis TaxID=82378 RepID=UPI003B21F7CB
MSQGLTYIGANQENSLKTVPHLNISTTALYQTSRSIQPSVVAASLSSSIRPTPSYSSIYATHLFTIDASPASYTERSGVESFTLSPIIITTSSTLEVLPTASSPLPRHFQTAQNWRTSLPLQSDILLPMPTVDLSTLIWSDTELNTLQSIMTLSTTVQPSSDAGYVDSGILSQVSESSRSLLSKLSGTTPPQDSAPASDLADSATMPPPTHAQRSSYHQTTITPSLKTLPPEWFKELSTPNVLRGSTEYYQSQTVVTDMAPTEPGGIDNDDENDDDDDDQSLRPAMTPSPSIIMESSTSYWNWSHRIPINSSNTTTMNKDGLSAPNKLLVVSVMVVLGCFAVTALALRIGNRIIKMRKKGNKKSCLAYLRSLCPTRNKEPRPKPMKVTVRMTRQPSKKNSVKSISSIRTIASSASGYSEKSTTSILRHSKSLANIHNHTDQPSTSTGGLTNSVKRSRTMDALLDIGAYSSDFHGPENLLESSSEATLLCKETKNKRTRFFDEVYDNPLMKISMDDSTGETSASFGSQTELQLFMDRPDSKDNLSDCQRSPPRSDNNSPICIISHARTDFDTPQDSPLNSDKSFENSETESHSDALKKFQLGKCMQWRALQQRCSSKDSGYVTTPTSPCQDGDLLPMQGFQLVDETYTDKEVAGIDIPKRRDSLVSSANSSPSSVYPLSSIEESPPPKSRCERCDSLYLASDDSFYSQDSRPQITRSQRTTWTQNISGLLRDTLANYLYATDRQYEEGYNSASDHYQSDYSYPYPEYTQEIPEYNENQDNTPPSPSLLTKFFKKKTTTISTQTSGPPLTSRRSSVNWHREDGTYMIKPREDAGMEFMGPIYLAKSVEDLGPYLSGSVMDNDLGNSSV